MMAVPELLGETADAYYQGAKMRVRVGYKLFAAKHMLAKLYDEVEFADQLVSNPQFYALKDLVAKLEGEIN